MSGAGLAAAIMAADLGAGPDSGLRVQLCGDAHLSNFGIFQAPDRRLVFDINDFDEIYPGTFEWDVKRLAASIAIGARDRGFKKSERREAMLSSVRDYRTAMAGFAAMNEIDIWYAPRRRRHRRPLPGQSDERGSAARRALRRHPARQRRAPGGWAAVGR